MKLYLPFKDSFSAVQANFENKSGGAASKPASTGGVNVEAAKKLVFPAHTFSITERDVIMYALGVGAKRTDLSMVYENSTDFATLPTYGVIPAFACQTETVSIGDVLPEFNPMMLLHGEQYLELNKPMPTSGKLTSQGKIVDILDKGKGAVVIIGFTTKDSTGAQVCYNEMTVFIRVCLLYLMYQGSGGFGGRSTGTDRGAATATNTPPKRAPDMVVQEKTSGDQAAVYRMSGDLNPLHIDVFYPL